MNRSRAITTQSLTRILVTVGLCLGLAACKEMQDPTGPKGLADPEPVLKTHQPVGAGKSLGDEPALTKGAVTDPQVLPSGDGLTQPEFYSGSGRLTGSGPDGGGAMVEGGGPVSLNFVNTDVREVIDVVLGDTLGVNYVIDPNVQGLVTVRTSKPLPRSEVIPVLSDILGQNNAIIAQVGSVFQVVPRDGGSPRLSTPVLSNSMRHLSQGYGIHILPLKYASASELMSVLETMVTPGALRPDPARNLLLFAGSASQARDLEQMVEIFDVDWMTGMSFALLPAKVAEVDQLTSELEAVFAQDSDGPLTGVVRFLPIERLNAVLVITQQPKYLERARLWVERLDRGGEVTGRQLFVYYVKNARAEDLAETLNAIFEGGGQRADDSLRGAQLAPGLVPAELTSQNYEQGLLAGQPPQPAQQANVEAAGGPVREPPGLPITRTGIAAGEGAALGSIRDDSDVRIIADDHNNALLILASPAEFRMIEATLDRLDLVPLQVLIEATIAEVTLNDELRYGLNWAFENGDLSGTFSSLSSGAVAGAFPGFSLLVNSTQAQVVLNALTEITDVNIVSSPQLLVLDNQSARLQVGDEVPVATQSAVSVTDAQAPVVNSIELLDTGVVLEVTPRVNPGGLVVLDIIQEVSTPVTTATSDIDSPTIQQRRIESSVVVQSGETVALGGLITDTETETVSGVPGLSAIPVLGHLFKTTSEVVMRTELLVLITPRVIRSTEEAREVTEELRRRLSSLTPLESKIRRTIKPPTQN